MDQTSIFDIMYPKYKIIKSIRLIEFFAGYGSQALALKYLGVKFEHWKICEWAVKSIQAYKDIHFTNEKLKGIDIDKLKEQDIKDYLFEKGISSNYNEPMTKQQIERLSEEQLRNILNNIYQTHNLVNIQQAKGEDLEIVDTDKYDYILTYSFPCQDLSLAGKGKGMSDTTMPQILLMENVPQVHSEDNKEDFFKWQLRLEELGYKNYMQDLIATDYGIPQTRNRCFMISILGDYSYIFPKPTPLKLKLKDLLEDNVDEKYYLSDKQIKDIQSWNAYEKPLETIDKDISKTLTTRIGAYCSGMQLVKDTPNYIEWEDGKNIQMNCRAWKTDKVVATLNTGGETKILIKNATKKDLCNKLIQNGLVEGGDCVGTAVKDDIGNLRIRKLTPKECFRLMGVKDEDYEKCAKNQSDNSLYHLAGDSIVVNVLMAIFKELL